MVLVFLIKNVYHCHVVVGIIWNTLNMQEIFALIFADCYCFKTSCYQIY